MLSFEHHSIYTYEIIDGEFSIKLEGEKSYFANLVNSAVKDLTEGLTTEEMKELIDVVEFIIYLPEEVLFIKSLLSYALSQAFVELYKKTGDPVLVGLALVADKVNSCKFKKNMIGTRGFNKIKEVIRSGIDYLNEKYENYKLNKSIKDKYKEIEKVTRNFDKSFNRDNIKVALK